MLRAFHVRSQHGEYQFLIEYNGKFFEVKEVKSSDTKNLFYTEIQKAIELIKDELILVYRTKV